MFNGSNCDRKAQLSGILTEPLNPREQTAQVLEVYTLHQKVRGSDVQQSARGKGVH